MSHHTFLGFGLRCPDDLSRIRADRQGEWAFFSPCTATNLNGSFTAKAPRFFTSSVYADPAQPCNQYVTTNAKIGQHGTSLTVGPSYQLSYASLPFRASGKLGGLTVRQSFRPWGFRKRLKTRPPFGRS